MASTVYPPLTASYPFVQGLNVKTFNIFSQRLIGTVGRNSRSKIVSLKTVVSSSTRGHNLPAGGSGYKIINQSMPGYFDDSLYSQQGVTVEKGSGPATNSYVTIEVLTASWTQTGSPFIEIQVWDNSNLSSGGAEEMTHGTGSGGTEIDGVQRWTNDSSAYTVNDGMFGVYGSETGTDAGFGDAHRYTIGTPVFCITGSDGTTVTGSQHVAQDLWTVLSGAVYYGRDGYGIPGYSSGWNNGPVFEMASRWSGLPLNVEYAPNGLRNVVRVSAASGSITIGITSSFPEDAIRVTSVPAGTAEASFASEVGIASFSETEGSLTFLPQYNLEIANFGYDQPETYEPFVEKVSLLGRGLSDGGGLFTSVGSGSEKGAVSVRASQMFAKKSDNYSAGVASSKHPFAEKEAFLRTKFNKAVNVEHPGKLYLVSQFISGAELNYGTEGSPSYFYTEGLKFFHYDYDIAQIPGSRYDIKNKFYWNGIIEPLDIRKEITGLHTFVGDFYDPISNTLKGSVSSTERQLTHLGLTVPISENYDIVNDIKITPFEFIDKGANIYGLSFPVEKYVESIPKQYRMTITNTFRDPDTGDMLTYDPILEEVSAIHLERISGAGGSYSFSLMGSITPHIDATTDPDYSLGQFSIRPKAKIDIAREITFAINSGTMGSYLSASCAENQPTVIINAISGSVSSGTSTPVSWPSSFTLRDFNEVVQGFDQWSWSSIPCRESTGGSYNDYSIYLNLLDLSENPDPFIEIETNVENYETLLRTSDRELQVILAVSSSVATIRTDKYAGAIPDEAGVARASDGAIIRFGSTGHPGTPAVWDQRGYNQRIQRFTSNRRPMDPFSDTERSTPRGIVYENTPFGYDSIAYGGYKK